MLINCGFNRKVKGGIVHKNVTRIDIGNLSFTDDHKEIIKILMDHKPSNENWNITGYAPIIEGEYNGN